MATFELHFTADKAARKEVKNPFYCCLMTKRSLTASSATSAWIRHLAHHLRARAGEGEGRRGPREGGRTGALHRWRLLGGLPEDDGTGGLYACFERRGLSLDANEPPASRADAVRVPLTSMPSAPRARRLRHALHGGRHRREGARRLRDRIALCAPCSARHAGSR